MPFQVHQLPAKYQQQAIAQLGKPPESPVPSKAKGSPKKGSVLSGGGPATPLGSDGRKSGKDGVYGGVQSVADIQLTLPYPPSTNAMWRNIVINGAARTLLSREGRAFKKQVADILTGMRLKPLVGPVGYELTLFRPRKRGDASNRVKSLEDALQGFCFADDEQIARFSVERLEDKTYPRCYIRLFNL